MSISVDNFDFTLVFFKAACQANQGAERTFAQSNS